MKIEEIKKIENIYLTLNTNFKKVVDEYLNVEINSNDNEIKNFQSKVNLLSDFSKEILKKNIFQIEVERILEKYFFDFKYNGEDNYEYKEQFHYYLNELIKKELKEDYNSEYIDFKYPSIINKVHFLIENTNFSSDDMSSITLDISCLMDIEYKRKDCFYENTEVLKTKPRDKFIENNFNLEEVSEIKKIIEIYFNLNNNCTKDVDYYISLIIKNIKEEYHPNKSKNDFINKLKFIQNNSMIKTFKEVLFDVQTDNILYDIFDKDDKNIETDFMDNIYNNLNDLFKGNLDYGKFIEYTSLISKIEFSTKIVGYTIKDFKKIITKIKPKSKDITEKREYEFVKFIKNRIGMVKATEVNDHSGNKLLIDHYEISKTLDVNDLKNLKGGETLGFIYTCYYNVDIIKLNSINGDYGI